MKLFPGYMSPQSSPPAATEWSEFAFTPHVESQAIVVNRSAYAICVAPQSEEDMFVVASPSWPPTLWGARNAGSAAMNNFGNDRSLQPGGPLVGFMQAPITITRVRHQVAGNGAASMGLVQVFYNEVPKFLPAKRAPVITDFLSGSAATINAANILCVYGRKRVLIYGKNLDGVNALTVNINLLCISSPTLTYTRAGTGLVVATSTSFVYDLAEFFPTANIWGNDTFIPHFVYATLTPAAGAGSADLHMEAYD